MTPEGGDAQNVAVKNVQTTTNLVKQGTATGSVLSSTSSDTKYPSALAVYNAINNADISDHTVNGAPLSNAASYYYGSGVGAATTAAKTVTIESITSAPAAGMTIVVTPATTSNVANPTLNLNSKGAKAIKYNNSTTITAADSGKIWTAGIPSIFVYDGTNWVFAGHGVDIDTDTTYTADETTITKTSGNQFKAKTAAVANGGTALTTGGQVYTYAQGKTSGTVYKIGYDGGWANAYNAVTVDTTYLKKTDDDTTGKTEVAIDTSKMTTSGTSGLSSSSTKLVQEKAIAQALALKQDKDTTQTYKVGYNGTWANLGTTLDPSASGYVADNAVTAATIANAISSAVSGADISDHTVNGAPLSNEASYYYGSGVGGATSTAKTVTIESITTAPTAGMTIVVNPATTATSGTSMTLNLNNTGAKAVKYEGSTTLTNAKSAAIWKKDVPVVFVYDGTNWLYEGNKYVAGTGISVSNSVITNAGVRSVTASASTADDGTLAVNTNGTTTNPAVKGWNKTVKYDGTNAVGSTSKGVWVDTDGTVKAMTHTLEADVPSTAEFTDTTYTFATGTTDGAFTVTPEGGSAQTVSVYGWSNKQNKPNKSGETTAAEGKVLTYTSNSLDNNVAARYIQVPVANNAPNGGSATVSTLADIWVE